MTAPLCEACGKRAFPSKATARHASRRHGDRVRVYQCPTGRGWHVTTQSIHDRARHRRRRKR